MKKSLFCLTVFAILFLITACSNIDQNNFEDAEVTSDEFTENETIDSSQPISDMYDPIEIAKILVEQEMTKRQIDPNNWEITEIEISSDHMIENIADYGKPVGKMRVVWVTGYVSGTEDVGNIDLELYKLEGDNVWYIDQHWGVLRAIEVPEMPTVDESSYQLSTSDKLPTDNNSLDESEMNNQEIEDDNETSEYFGGLEERFLNSMYEHFEDIGLIKYLEGGKFYIKDTEVIQTPSSISDTREYTYYLDGTLTTDFDALTENEQHELLTKINFGEVEFYEGHLFEVESIELVNGTDIFTRYSGSRTTNKIEKNGEMFFP
jgi:hypothetical protein